MMERRTSIIADLLGPQRWSVALANYSWGTMWKRREEELEGISWNDFLARQAGSWAAAGFKDFGDG